MSSESSSTQNPDAAGPLVGIRVIDFTQYQAGPFCTMLLADAGADVIKIEPPRGDGARLRGTARDRPGRAPVSIYFAASNRRKRSITLNLRTESGRSTMRRLIGVADVAVENFAHGSALRLGIDFNELRELNPRLITASISLFGRTGAEAELRTRPGIAVVAEAESGVGDQCRDARGVPVPIKAPIGDTAAGLAAYAGIVSALLERSRTGRGRQVDVSMVGTLFALSAVVAATYSIAGHDSRSTVPYGYYKTADGFIALALHQDDTWSRLAAAMGREDLARDPRYTDYEKRDVRADEVNRLIEDWTKTAGSDEIVKRLAAAEVPSGKVNNIGDMLTADRVRSLGMLEEVDDGLGGVVTLPSNPLGFASKLPRLPQPGEHTEAILGDLLGLSGKDIDLLRDKGAFS